MRNTCLVKARARTGTLISYSKSNTLSSVLSFFCWCPSLIVSLSNPIPGHGVQTHLPAPQPAPGLEGEVGSQAKEG